MDIVTVNHHSTNIYFIKTAKGLIMVDAGWPDTISELLGLLKQKGIRASDIKYMMVTHFHPDHAGLVQDFKNTGTTLVLHEIQIPYVEGINTYFKRKPEANFKTINFLNNVYLTSAESRKFLMELNINGEIFPTPGHSKDSISLLIDNCCVFTGDLPPVDSAQGYDNPDTKQSWEKILHYQVKQIYPAHGKPYPI